jgi:hypothetical protein
VGRVSWVVEAFNLNKRPYLAIVEKKGKHVSVEVISRLHEKRGEDEPGDERWHFCVATFNDDVPDGTVLKARESAPRGKPRAIITYYVVTWLGPRRVPYKSAMKLAAMDIGMREQQVIREPRPDPA